MKRMTVLLALFGLLILPLTEGRAQTTEKKAGEGTSDSFPVTGVLVATDGAPIAGKSVYLLPLGSNGKPLAFYGFDKQGVMRMNNPEGKTDRQGRFTIKMHRQFTIGDHKVREFAVGLDKDKLVSQDGAAVKVKFDDKTKKVELGKVVSRH
jgi:hypothetical protein